MTAVRQTWQKRAILDAIERHQPVHGYDLMAHTGLSSGTLYPALRQLRNLGLVIGCWENVDPREVGRPRRQLYRIALTAEDRSG